MSNLREDIVDWLYEDFLEAPADKLEDSVLVSYLLDTHAQSFRVRARHLARRASEGNLPAKKELIKLLAEELMAPQRFSGKRESEKRVIESMLGCPSLAVLGCEACKDAKSVRARLTKLLNDLETGSLASAEAYDTCMLVQLAQDLLEARPAKRQNPVEALMEQAELDGTVAEKEPLILKKAIQEAKDTLYNLGRPLPKNGEIPEAIVPRTKGIDPGLVELYLKTHDIIADREELIEDLADLYCITRDDANYVRLCVPASIDKQTGVGLYLIGKEKLARYSMGLDRHATTVVAIDNRLGDPQELLGADVLEQDDAAIRRLLVVMKKSWAKDFHPVRHNAKISSLDKYLGGSGKRAELELDSAVSEMFNEYVEMSRISIEGISINDGDEDDSFKAQQGIDHAPEDCPNRFLKYFV